LIAKSYRWHKTAMTAATAALLGLWGADAMALSLGRITVQSALGEPLRAEIEIPDINAEEAASLKTAIALPEAFPVAGFEYNPALSGLQISLQRRPDGRTYLRLNGNKAITDPFIDLIVEVNWGSGRIARDYTMLFDPPNLRQPAAASPITAPQITSAPASASVMPPPPPVSSSLVRPAPATPKRSAAEPAEPAAKATSTGPQRVTIKSGDTASKIAVAIKPVGVSLDQMLVALLRTNPEAFVGGNINRIKAGAVMNVPSAEQAQATPAREATQAVIAQSKDFNDFRRKLASSAPTTQVDAASRKASGNVQARVEEKKPATAAPDKLTLSKGTVQGKPAEDQIAKDRGAKEAANRAAELAKNISELSKLGVPSVPASAPATSITAAPSAALPKTAASVPVKRPVVAAPMPAAGPSLVDGLLENPLVPAGAGGLIALLAAFGFYRMRQRKKAPQVDSSFLESRLQPDSFFGASGGQRVDTEDSASADSSQMHSPSQMNSVNEVDPVAEADVYLAYGRDLQAEEILKASLRTHPERVAIHQKLLEIYAKRGDLKGFESIATEARQLTGAKGTEWAHICELGLSIDPDNALYQQGGQLPAKPGPASEPSAESPGEFADTPASESGHVRPATPVDLDLDLDFSLDNPPESGPGSNAEPTASMPAAESAQPSFAMALDQATDAHEGPAIGDTPAEPDSGEFALPDLEFTSDELSLPPDAGQPATSEPAAPADSGMLEFDLGSLSLDLGTPVEAAPAAPEPSPEEDSLATKLALAEEFSAIGDTDGARALIEEIIAEATGDMKTRAEQALSKLN